MHGNPGTPRLRVDFDLSRNEVHFDPLPEVRNVFESSVDALCRYPEDGRVALLAEQIGALHAVPREQVVIGPGSVGVLDALLHADPRRGSTVFGTPTFDEYAVLVSRAGGMPVGATSDPPGHQSLARILARVDASTQQVIIATPHNPSGAAVSVDELVRFRQALPKSVLLVVDQAYAEFDETMPDDAVRRIVSMDGVAVLRSFSKAYGLAGLRIGYGLFSSAALAARVRSAVPTYAVNSFAIAAASESLRQHRQLRERVARVIDNRKRLEEFLVRRHMGAGIVSQGNFVWLPSLDSHALFLHALTEGILLREYPGLGVRITVQSDEAVGAVMRWLASHSRVHA